MDIVTYRRISETYAAVQEHERWLRLLAERLSRIEAAVVAGSTPAVVDNPTLSSMERRIRELESRPRGPGRPRANG